MVSKSGRIRILLIDDHPAIGAAVRVYLDRTMDLELIGHALSAAKGLEMARALKPDVALVDISLEDSHGLDLVNNLRIQVPDCDAIVFSMYDEKIFAERALRAGAKGYVPKSAPVESIIDAVRMVAGGHVFVSRDVTSRILGRVSSGRDADAVFPIDSLTDREMAVFQLLGEGHSLRYIMKHLSIARKTAEAYRRRIRDKLGLASTNELLHYAIEWKRGGPSR